MRPQRPHPNYNLVFKREATPNSTHCDCNGDYLLQGYSTEEAMLVSAQFAAIGIESELWLEAVATALGSMVHLNTNRNEHLTAEYVDRHLKLWHLRSAGST